MTRLPALANYRDYRAAAKSILPGILFDYIDGGSYDEITLGLNERAFHDIVLTQRVMQDVSDVSSSISLFGQTLEAPIVLAPVGFSGMYARRGEVQAARAARAENLPFCLSTVGICSIEEVAEGAGTPPWFQLYMIKDREWMKVLLGRAKEADCPVLVLTGDLQTPGTRYRDIRSGMMRNLSPIEHLSRALEGARKYKWTYDVWLQGRPHTFGNLDGVLPKAASFDQAWRWISNNFDPSITWKDLDFIRSHWDGPILLKGVMCADDAAMAEQEGLDGIVVSNHGGRQLDSAEASVTALKSIRDKLGSSLSILVDGGVRSGLDVLKALQEGADACMIGRPWAFALAAGGERAVGQYLSSTLSELRTAQTLTAQVYL